jgi:hypothetical protein
MAEFYWDPDPAVRTRHLYIPGQSGFGKTSLMANLALDDIEQGEGPVIILDPKGSSEGLVERVIKHIPLSLIPDTFYVSLEHPVPIDMMSYRNQFEKNFIRSDIKTILRRFSEGNTWGTTMDDTIINLVPTLLEAEDTTFLDIGRFLESKSRREEILAQVSPERQKYWAENPVTKESIGPIKTRMSVFKEPPIRDIVNTKRGEGISVAEIIENNQILLVDAWPLSEEGLMLCALIMSRIQQAVFRRKPGEKHSLCMVYADEFHHYATSGFGTMLTQARSFGLSLCLANQHPGQIKDVFDDVKGISSYMMLRVDGEHADKLKSKISEPEKIEKPYIYKRAVHQRIAELKKSEEWWYPTEANMDDNPWIERRRLEDILEEADRPIRQPRTFLEQIPKLPVGHAVFVDHTGETARVKMPLPPEPPEKYYKEEIIQHTAQYVASRQKRTGDNAPSNSPQVSHTGENGTRNTDPTPSGTPNIPPHESKKRKS